LIVLEGGNQAVHRTLASEHKSSRHYLSRLSFSHNTTVSMLKAFSRRFSGSGMADRQGVEEEVHAFVMDLNKPMGITVSQFELEGTNKVVIYWVRRN